MHNALASLAVVIGGALTAIGVGMFSTAAGVAVAGVLVAGIGYSQIEDSE